MTRKEIYAEVKKDLNELATSIRTGKALRKPSAFELADHDDRMKYHRLEQYRWKFRHLHIARCELRGRTRDQIENPAETNKPDESAIAALKSMIQEKLDEALRSDAA